MSQPKRATVYFDEDVHRALRLRAAEADLSISEMVNDAVRRALAEDADDLAALEGRKREPTVDFAAFVRDMKKRGRL